MLLKIRSIHKIATEGLLAQLQKLYFKGPSLCAREKLSQAVLRTLKVDIRHALLEVLCCKQTFIYFLNRGWKSAIISIFGLHRLFMPTTISSECQCSFYSWNYTSPHQITPLWKDKIIIKKKKSGVSQVY